MMKPSVSNSRFLQENCISAMNFSHNAEYCAIATKKDHTIHVYKISTLNKIDSWTLLQDLKDHTQTISGIEWTSDNKILTSSHDRSVFVWKKVSENKWDRMLVNIDVKLSVLVSKWAPSGKKFTLGCACNTIALGFFNVPQNCWVMISRDHTSKVPITTSPITTLSFHPSSNLIAVGTAENKVKIVTSSLRKTKDQMIIQSKVEDDDYKGPFQGIDSLFEIIYSIQNLGGWINYISFENNGTSLLVLPHHNHIKVIDIADNSQVAVGEEDIKWKGLPFMSGYISQNKDLILGGFDKKVARFVKRGNYVFDSYLQKNQKTGVATKMSLVSNITRGLQKRQTLFDKGPSESDHVNTVNILQVQGKTISYDVNGIIHFWQN